MSKTIFIVGIGRSGTKLLQILVAYIVADQWGELNLHYEPLLWDSYQLRMTNPDGMSVHKSLPLLLTMPYNLSAEQRRFFSQFGGVRRVQSVTKFIRMTGRLPLIRALYNGAQLIFVYRNPVAVINSILNQDFSLLGPPNYESDLPRLVEEAKCQRIISQQQVDRLNSYTWGKEAIHWYVLNKKATRDIPVCGALVLSYESVIEEKESCLRSLCTHLEADYKSEYVRLLDIPGYNIRYVDQLLMPSERRNLHGGLRSIEDTIRRAVGRSTSTAMFTGARELSTAPIFSVARRVPEREVQLTAEEEMLVNELCGEVLSELESLRKRRARRDTCLAAG